MSKKRVEFVVHGTVQGVGFRYYVYSAAQTLKLKGYVKNQWDGTVLSVVEGEDTTIDLFHDYLKRGPSLARVEKVEVNVSEPINEFKTFAIM